MVNPLVDILMNRMVTVSHPEQCQLGDQQPEGPAVADLANSMLSCRDENKQE